MKATRGSALALACSVFALGVVGCGEDDEMPLTPTPAPTVMVVHLSPNAPGIDIYVDDVVIPSLAGLPYPNNSGYLTQSAGNRNFKLKETGTATTLVDTTFDLVQGNSHTLVACDSAASASAVVLLDDLAVPAPGKVRVRFGHFSPNSPAVDVAVAGGGVIFGNQSFKDFTDFMALDAGSYDLEVRLAGQPTVLLSVNGVVLESGKIYSIFARGFNGGGGGQELAAEIIENK